MLVQTLHSVKRSLRNSPLRGALDRLGLLGAGRKLYNSMLLKKGTHTTTVLGQHLTFAVSSQIEIIQIDGLFHEDEFMSRILAHVGPSDVVFDIGANIGLVSALIASKTRGQGVRVHAFEPEPKNADRCEENMRLNKFDSVQVHRCAVGQNEGTVSLFVQTGVGAAEHTIVPQVGKGRGAIDVRLRKADDIAAEVGAPKVVKIDVEGAEMEVLLGSQGLLARKAIRDLFIEVHLGRIFTPGFDEHKLRSWIEERGYKLVWKVEHGTSWHHHYQAA